MQLPLLSKSIFEDSFLPLKIYSQIFVRLTKDPGAVCVVLHVGAEEKSQMVLIDLNKWRSESIDQKGLISGHESFSFLNFKTILLKK